MLGIKKTKSRSTYANYLKALKIFYLDYLKQGEAIADYKFPKKQYKPKVLPTKEQLRIFYNALPEKYKVIFLALASSGLRVSELLNAEIGKNNRMLIPKSHDGATKKAWGKPLGRPPTEGDKAKKRIPELLKNDPQLFGFLKGRWVVRDIAKQLKTEAINLSFQSVDRILHDLEISLKRPKLGTWFYS